MDKDTKTIDIKFPTRWEDLTQKQLRYVFTLIAQARNNCMDTLREVFRQFMSKLILEKTKLENHCIYIDPRISFLTAISSRAALAPISRLQWTYILT